MVKAIERIDSIKLALNSLKFQLETLHKQQKTPKHLEELKDFLEVNDLEIKGWVNLSKE